MKLKHKKSEPLDKFTLHQAKVIIIYYTKDKTIQNISKQYKF